MIDTAARIALVLMAAALLLNMWRLLRGPSAADRVAALDTMYVNTLALLVLLGVWRHVVRRHPLAYDPQYWGMVFPLGMYAAATFRLAEALSMAPLAAISRAFLPIAIVAWTMTLLGLLRSLLLRRRFA